MSTTRLLILRTSAASGAAVLALAGMAGAASAQTGSLESGVGQGIESVLGPVGEMLPGSGSLDEAVSDARAGAGPGGGTDPGAGRGPDAGVGPGAGSSEAPGGAQRAFPAPFDSPAVAAGSLDPLPSALGPGAATGPDPAALSALEPVSDPGAGLTAVAVMVDVLAGGGSDMVDPVELPPLPAPR